MGQGDCEDQCDKCPDTGPVYRIGSYNLCFGCREEVRYDALDQFPVDARDMITDLRVMATACSEREQQLLSEGNRFRLDLSDVLEIESLEHDDILECIEEDIKHTNELEDQIQFLAGLMGSKSTSLQDMVDAYGKSKANMATVGFIAANVAWFFITVCLFK